MNAPCLGNDPLLNVEVCDAYLAAWLLINDCTIVQCTWRPNAGPLGGLMVFSGSRVHELVQAYFNHNARAEIWEFRGATNRITQCLHEARDQQRQTLSETEGKGGCLVNSTVSTCNMAEALYLLRCGNRVVKVRLAWPDGLEECAIVFEGERAEADHDCFISHEIPVDLRMLPGLFAAITAVARQGGDE